MAFAFRQKRHRELSDRLVTVQTVLDCYPACFHCGNFKNNIIDKTIKSDIIKSGPLMAPGMKKAPGFFGIFI